jgi:hypothetical protein
MSGRGVSRGKDGMTGDLSMNEHERPVKNESNIPLVREYMTEFARSTGLSPDD